MLYQNAEYTLFGGGQFERDCVPFLIALPRQQILQCHGFRKKQVTVNGVHGENGNASGLSFGRSELGGLRVVMTLRGGGEEDA